MDRREFLQGAAVAGFLATSATGSGAKATENGQQFDIHRLAPMVQLSKTPSRWRDPMVSVRGGDKLVWEGYKQ